MKRNERRILRGLWNYWDGKRFRWEDGPIPAQGDYVVDRDLAESLGFRCPPLGAEHDPRFSYAVDALMARGLVKERTAFDEFEPDGVRKLVVTPEGIQKAEERPILAWFSDAGKEVLVGVIVAFALGVWVSDQLKAAIAWLLDLWK